MYPPMIKISAESLKQRMDNHDEIVILDVRDDEERGEFHISGDTLFIPFNELSERLAELEPYRNHEIIIYCNNGYKSGQACYFLYEQGFMPINLIGGTLQWKELYNL